MLSEVTINVATNKLDYRLRPMRVTQQEQQQLHHQHQLHEQPELFNRSCSDHELGQNHRNRNVTQTDLVSGSPPNDRLLSNNADNLSWTFFEQVSSLDTRLRFGETDVTHFPESDGGRLTTTIGNDVNLKAYDGLAFDDERQHPIPHPLTIANISNGLTTKKKLAIDIVSEQSPDLLLSQSQQQHQLQEQQQHQQQHQQQQQEQQQHQQQEQKQQHKRTNSIVTITTLQQNQDVQPVHPQQYNNNNQRGLDGPKNHNNNNRNKENNNNSLESNNITRNYHQQSDSHHLNHQHHHHHQQTSNIESDFENHDQTTAMISGVFEADTEATGSGTTPRATRIRHLPAITKLTNPAYAEGVDLVGDANLSTRRQSHREREHRSHPSSLKRMGAATKSNLDSHSFVEGIETQLGLIGWRKKCLYILLVLLMLLIIVNLALTLWILKVMEFTTEGMGQLKILPGGIQLTGQALILDMLRASTIRSRHGQPISIESSRNFSINTRDTNGVLENHLFLGHDKLECLATGFRINDTTGRNLFSVNRNEVTIGAHALRIDGEGGAIFRESIQTPHVRAEPGRELRLESPTRQLELTAAKDINLQSRAGGIELTALEDVKLSALDGSLRFESAKILMPNLRTAQPALPGTAPNRDHQHRIFQLCACANGKLFLAAPHSICAGDDSTVCR